MTIPTTTVNYHLKEAAGYIEGEETLSVSVRCEQDNLALLLDLKGHGLSGMESGNGSVVALEYYEGRPRLLVWADINQEEPTHVIDLSESREECRIE